MEVGFKRIFQGKGNERTCPFCYGYQIESLLGKNICFGKFGLLCKNMVHRLRDINRNIVRSSSWSELYWVWINWIRAAFFRRRWFSGYCLGFTYQVTFKGILEPYWKCDVFELHKSGFFIGIYFWRWVDNSI